MQARERTSPHSPTIHPRHHANFRIFDPLDFLVEVSPHIPDAHEKDTEFEITRTDHSGQKTSVKPRNALLTEWNNSDGVPCDGGRGGGRGQISAHELRLAPPPALGGVRSSRCTW